MTRALTLTALKLLLVPLTLGACGGGDLDGFEWDVTVAGTGDNPYEQNLVYRLTFEEGTSTVNLAIGAENFASGQISGCGITYQSVVWGELRDGFEVRWKLDGEATYQLNSGCETSLSEGLDWEGTEVFSIVQSDHPDIPTGATYTVDVQGTYLGEAGQ